MTVSFGLLKVASLVEGQLFLLYERSCRDQSKVDP